jgi:predicted GNAT family N-acyltransferase
VVYYATPTGSFMISVTRISTIMLSLQDIGADNAFGCCRHPIPVGVALLRTMKRSTNMIEVKRFKITDKYLADQAFAIRRRVFVEEQGVDAALEYDKEDQATHYLMLLAGKPVAAARWRETEKGIKLERFAVLPEFRNRGFGEIILEAVLKDVAGSGQTIYLHSQSRAVRFYERNGFLKEGAMFVEAGIEHYYMKYAG